MSFCSTQFHNGFDGLTSSCKIIHVSQLEEKSIHALQLGHHGEDLLIHTLEAVVALPLYQGRELPENRAEYPGSNTHHGVLHL
uniref:Uncharacterized protein n=1 Tax=Oryza meridionalis TaxID=40149 RepID=A0A0E0F4F3_9ORYZ